MTAVKLGISLPETSWERSRLMSIELAATNDRTAGNNNFVKYTMVEAGILVGVGVFFHFLFFWRLINCRRSTIMLKTRLELFLSILNVTSLEYSLDL